MNAIILAAGMGRRLATMGWNKPKCLLPVGDNTLLGNTLDALDTRGVTGAIIVVGYQRELVEREAKRHHLSCAFVENPDFADTNTIYSLYLARNHLTEDCLYFNADVWFEPPALDLLLVDPPSADALLLVDKKRCGPEEVKVNVDREGRIGQIGKTIDPADCAGEFVGIARFNQSINPALIAAIEHRCNSPGERNLFFETAVNDIVGEKTVLAMPLDEHRAVEIDTPEDYRHAQNECAKTAGE